MTEQNRVKAHFLKDLRLLIAADFFYFRAKITFQDKKELNCYGDEHSVSYKQCLAGFAKEIELDATKGYTALLQFIERHGKAGNIRVAKVFGRDNLGDGFNTVHRVFTRGKWGQINDPVIPADQNTRILDFIVNKSHVEITGLREKELPDFKAEVAMALNEPKLQEQEVKSTVKKDKKIVKKVTKKRVKEQDHSVY